LRGLDWGKPFIPVVGKKRKKSFNRRRSAAAEKKGAWEGLRDRKEARRKGGEKK